MIIINLGLLFALYLILISSIIWLVLSWTVTFDYFMIILFLRKEKENKRKQKRKGKKKKKEITKQRANVLKQHRL